MSARHPYPRLTLDPGDSRRRHFPEQPYVHRVVASHLIPRPLDDEEVVHHEGDWWDATPRNLLVFASGADHTSYHALLRRGGELRRQMEPVRLSRQRLGLGDEP